MGRHACITDPCKPSVCPARFSELAEVVDFFVLLEAPWSHRGAHPVHYTQRNKALRLRNHEGFSVQSRAHESCPVTTHREEGAEALSCAGDPVPLVWPLIQNQTRFAPFKVRGGRPGRAGALTALCVVRIRCSMWCLMHFRVASLECGTYTPGKYEKAGPS